MEQSTAALAARGMDLGQPVIDVDIHCNVPSAQALFPYLSAHWREYMTYSAFKGPTDTPYPGGAPTTALPGTRPENGPPGSSLALVREQVLDAWNVEVGILNCSYAVESLHNPDTAAAMASAVNDWIIHEWLEQEPRLRASIVVPSRVPEMAAKEIDRVGGHPGVVQVYLPVVSEAPYGHRRYWPIFEAAARHDLVVSLQFGGSPGQPADRVRLAVVLPRRVRRRCPRSSRPRSSTCCVEGVFDHFPTLRIAMIEGGWTWLPSLMWRIDKDWKGLRREVPWNTQAPSEYIRERMRFSLQPLDASPDPRHMLMLIDQFGSDDLLMFSTDYPHWQFDTPEEALPAGPVARATA